MAKEKSTKSSNSGVELISADKIKKEPDDVTPVSVSKPSSLNKTITVLTSPPSSTTKSSTTQPKTILLVQTMNSRTGGIQSLLLPQGLRSLPSTTSDITISVSRPKMSTLLAVGGSSVGKTQSSVPPKMAECFLTSATGLTAKTATSSQPVQSQIQAQMDVKSLVKLSSVAPSVPQRVCELTFKSRTIQADGTVCTLKEYLCNFCQYKVASQGEFRDHFMTHVFSCNYCSFRAFTRYEVLGHKKEKHQGIAEELAGYEGLDSFSDQMSSILADWRLPTTSVSSTAPIIIAPAPVVITPTSVTNSQVPLTTTTATTSTVTSSEITVTMDSESGPLVVVAPKPSVTVPSVRIYTTSPGTMLPSSSLISVSRSFALSTPVASQTSQPITTSMSTSLVTAALLAQKKTPIVTSNVSSPLVLPISTVKTTASVGKTNDNFFTYKIVHDAAGKVQAYECDVCSYRSTKINEIFAHASTHSLTDLMKSNSANVQWECFYCSFTSVLQANVVSHVIAKHPNKPIQLKRMVTNATQRSTSRSVLLRGPNFSPDPGLLSKPSPSASVKKKKVPTATLR